MMMVMNGILIMAKYDKLDKSLDSIKKLLVLCELKENQFKIMWDGLEEIFKSKHSNPKLKNMIIEITKNVKKEKNLFFDDNHNIDKKEVKDTKTKEFNVGDVVSSINNQTVKYKIIDKRLVEGVELVDVEVLGQGEHVVHCNQKIEFFE